jgi:hypothetical protein
VSKRHQDITHIVSIAIHRKIQHNERQIFPENEKLLKIVSPKVMTKLSDYNSLYVGYFTSLYV